MIISLDQLGSLPQASGLYLVLDQGGKVLVS